MKSFKSIFAAIIMVGLISFGLTACNQAAHQGKTTTAISQKVVKPDTLNMSKDTLAMRVQQKTMQEIQKRQARIEKEAIEVVKQTNQAMKFIYTGNAKKAEAALGTALDSTKTLLKKHPNDDLIPVDISVKAQDLITTIPQVDQTVKTAKEEMTKGNYQEAAGLLNNLKSEIDITTVNLPLGGYPSGLKQALGLLKKNKTNQAQQVLVGLMNSLVINQAIMPLPVLRAQVMMDEAQIMFNGKQDKAKVVNLLKNADYQLKLAQALGYGHFDKEYTDISNDIAKAKESVKNGSATSGTFDKLIKKTEAFKNKIVNDVKGTSSKKK